MRTSLPKRVVLLWLSLLTLAACAASRFTPVIFSQAATNTPTAATSMPQPQAIPMGVLGKGSANDIAWSPDGELLAVGSSVGGFLYDTRTWEVRGTIPLDAFKTKFISELAFSPHGKTLLFLSNDYDASLMRYDLQTRNVTLPVEDGKLVTRDMHMPVFSADEKIFAIQTAECEQNLGCSHTLEIRDAATGDVKHQLLELLPGASNTITSILFSPNGEMIAAGTSEGQALVWDASSGARRHVFQHDSAVSDLAFSGDSSVLVSASQDATVRFWDTQSGESLAILRGFTRPIQHAAFILNDQRLLVGQYDGTFLEWSLRLPRMAKR